MSRVDDDRDAARLAARLAEQRRLEEGKKKDKASQDSNFSKLVGQQKAQAQKTQADTTARDVLSHLLEQQEAPHGEAQSLLERGTQQQQETAFKSRMGTRGLQEKVSGQAQKDTDQGLKGKISDQQGSQQASTGRAADQGSAASKTESRQTDAKVGSEALEERKEASDTDSSNRSQGPGGAKGGKGALKTDTEGGGGQQGGSGKDSKDNPAMGPGFRFNPALMAPVPVANKKEVAGSERLRQVANELAQKIVERVRVGTNAMGNAEFQIDLRGNVLSGMSVKVSAKNGKITAVFSGSDKDVLKMIEEQGEALEKALGARGLKLEEFKVEART